MKQLYYLFMTKKQTLSYFYISPYALKYSLLLPFPTLPFYSHSRFVLAAQMFVLFFITLEDFDHSIPNHFIYYKQCLCLAICLSVLFSAINCAVMCFIFSYCRIPEICFINLIFLCLQLTFCYNL